MNEKLLLVLLLELLLLRELLLHGGLRCYGSGLRDLRGLGVFFPYIHRRCCILFFNNLFFFVRWDRFCGGSFNSFRGFLSLRAFLTFRRGFPFLASFRRGRCFFLRLRFFLLFF